MIKRILCISILLLPFLSFCQQSSAELNTVDSLKSIISSSVHDTTKLNAYKAWDNIIYLSDQKLDIELNEKIIDLATLNLKKLTLSGNEKIIFQKKMAAAINNIGISHFGKANYSEAKEYFSRALKIMEELNDKKGMAKGYTNMGNISSHDGDFKKALELYNLSLKLNEQIDDKKGIAMSLNNIGLYYFNQGDLSKTIDYYIRSLKIREQIDDKKGVATSLNNISIVYWNQKDYSKALEYCFKSLKIREEMSDNKGISTTENNIGLIYKDGGDKEKALEHFFIALKKNREVEDKSGTAISLNNIGIIYHETGDNKKALEYYLLSLKIREEIADKRGIASSYTNIGLVYKDQGDYAKAIEYGKKGIALSQEVKSVLETQNASKALFESYKKTGNYKDALEMHQLYMTMSDSIMSENNQKEILKHEMQYNFEKQKALDEKEHEKSIAISIEQEKKQKVISYSIALGLLLVALFAIFVLNRLHVTRKQKMVIEQQKKLVEVQKDLVEEKQKEILDSINYAKRLQDAILPSETLVKKLLPEGFILYKPKDIVAGDFYWMESTEDVIYYAAADCTGHGVPGAMVSVVCCNALNRVILEFGKLEPGKILDKTRELVVETFSKSDTDVKDGMDISLCSINKKTNEIKWAGAYNPLWYVHNGILEELSANKQPIGKTEHSSPFTTHTIQLNKGDSIYLFTDGYADQFGGEKGKKFKYKPMKELILNNVALSPEIQKGKLELAFDKWKGHLEQVDDVCIIGIRI